MDKGIKSSCYTRVLHAGVDSLGRLWRWYRSPKSSDRRRGKLLNVLHTPDPGSRCPGLAGSLCSLVKAVARSLLALARVLLRAVSSSRRA